MTKSLNLPIVHIKSVPSWVEDRTAQPMDDEREQAKVLVDACKQYGTAIIRPNRDIAPHRKRFIEAMEQFHPLPEHVKRKYVSEHTNPSTGKTVKYEVGHMPRLAEIAEKTPEYGEYIAKLPDGDEPMLSEGRNIIERWMHPVGPRPSSTSYAELNQPAIEVDEVPDMLYALDTWGETVLEISITVAEYLALGLGIPLHSFSDLLIGGPHVLAPTTVNLAYEYCVYAASGDTGTAERMYRDFAAQEFRVPHMTEAMMRWLKERRTLLDAFHSDLNFFTAHAMSNTKALAIFLATHERVEVAGLDPGCILIQTGRQLRHMTGGVIPAMYHEVTTTPDMIPFARDRMEHGVPPIRVGCPLFVHIASDHTLRPMHGLGNAEAYPPIQAGAFVNQILERIYGNG